MQNPTNYSPDFTVHVIGFQQSTDTFSVSEDGTEVKIGVGNYHVTRYSQSSRRPFENDF
jgi:hypothetical protein